MVVVPREAMMVEPSANRRRYRSPKRAKAGEEKRKALIGAALDLIAAGHFRFGAQQLADKAGVRRQSIARYFGSVDLLYRVLAREHWQFVAVCLPFDVEHRPAEAVWSVLVGKPRELS